MTKAVINKLEKEIEELDAALENTRIAKDYWKRVKPIEEALTALGVQAGDELHNDRYWGNRYIKRVEIILKAKRKRCVNQMKRLQK